VKRFSIITGISHYVLGFAGEGNRFIEQLIDRHGLQPKLIVINLDGVNFFDQPKNTTTAAIALETEIFSPYVEYFLKYTGQRLQRVLCAPSPIYNFFCGDWDTIYRETSTGHRQTAHRSIPIEKKPVTYISDIPTAWVKNKDKILAEAKSFSKNMEKRGICVVLTNVPSGFTLAKMEIIALRLAEEMGAFLILPTVDDLYTSDRSHLTPDNAERFSSVLMESLRPHMMKCQ
jgi:hypothetical protein